MASHHVPYASLQNTCISPKMQQVLFAIQIRL
uniref:Uncharacterized protein n=1 Tax=Anguilla anguilla TaxID=7936 RepID=A0A0E9RVQ8_ANGAN